MRRCLLIGQGEPGASSLLRRSATRLCPKRAAALAGRLGDPRRWITRAELPGLRVSWALAVSGQAPFQTLIWKAMWLMAKRSIRGGAYALILAGFVAACPAAAQPQVPAAGAKVLQVGTKQAAPLRDQGG